MNIAAADRIAKAVLYEGYMLYPYRPSAVKNQQRFNFGVLYPRAFSEAQKGTDPWTLQVECLIQGAAFSRLEVRVRFLQLVERSVEEAVAGNPDAGDSVAEFRAVKNLTVDERSFYSWQEAVERELTIATTDLASFSPHPLQHSFQLAASTTEESLRDTRGALAGRIVRTQRPIDGAIHVSAHPVAENIFKIVVRVQNVTLIDSAARFGRESALLQSLVSAHVVLGVEDGEFVSLLDPPEALRPEIEDCHNQGVFPVLVGEAGQRDTMLASPIILYDYPQIAPESAGDLFDGTEVDEILSLRIMTMTDEEKCEMRQSDERARQMLERTESLPAEQFMKMHGALRGLRPVNEETR
jgi:hydrogenase maturation protease